MTENIILDDGYQETLSLTGEAKEYLKTAAGWAKFLAIVGFVSLGFTLLAAIFMGSILGSLAGMPGAEMYTGMAGWISVFYILFVALFFYPILCLYRFASKTQQALQNNNTQVLTEALGGLKSYFKFFGIMMAIFIGFYALILLLGLIGFMF